MIDVETLQDVVSKVLVGRSDCALRVMEAICTVVCASDIIFTESRHTSSA